MYFMIEKNLDGERNTKNYFHVDKRGQFILQDVIVRISL